MFHSVVNDPVWGRAQSATFAPSHDMHRATMRASLQTNSGRAKSSKSNLKTK
jgi:hypothetical protein